MSAGPEAPFEKLEILGDHDADVCGPDGCLLPPDHDALAEAPEPA